MDNIQTVEQLNTLVIQAMASSQKALDCFYFKNFSEPSINILLESIEDSNHQSCSQTKVFSMKMLTLFLEENQHGTSILQRLENFFLSNFIEISPILLPFSIDLFASAFKDVPECAMKIFSVFNDKNDILVLKYVVRYIRKRCSIDGFECYISIIFKHIPEYPAILNEMLDINSISKFLIPFILIEKIHFRLFELMLQNSIYFEAVSIILDKEFCFESTENYDLFVADCITMFFNILKTKSQYYEKSKLLITLRSKAAFRRIVFGTFFIELIQEIYRFFEYSFINFSNECKSVCNFVFFFGNLNQLCCSTQSRDAQIFIDEVMQSCRALICSNLFLLDNINPDIFLDKTDLEFFYTKCVPLFKSDYQSSVGNLLNNKTKSSFSILREMISSNKMKWNKTEFIDFDTIIFTEIINQIQASLIPNSNERNQIISFEFFISFLKEITQIYSSKSFFPEEYCISSWIILLYLQNINYEVDNLILQDAVDIYSIIPFDIEIQSNLLLLKCTPDNPNQNYFPCLMNNIHKKKICRRLFCIIFERFSSISAKIVDNLLFYHDRVNILSALCESPVEIIANKIFPMLNIFCGDEKSSFHSPINLTKFIKSSLQKIILNDNFSFMCYDIITIIKSICHILLSFCNIQENSLKPETLMHIEILKIITLIFQIKSINISAMLFYNDSVIQNLIYKFFEIIGLFDINFLCNHIKTISAYFAIIYESADISEPFINDEMIFLLMKIIANFEMPESIDIDLMKNLFNPLKELFLQNRISQKYDGLTDILLEKCMRRCAIERGAVESLLKVTAFLCRINSSLFSLIVDQTKSKNQNNLQLQDIAESILNLPIEEVNCYVKSFSKIYTHSFPENHIIR